MNRRPDRPPGGACTRPPPRCGRLRGEHRDERIVRARHRGRRVLPLRRPRLIGGDREQEAWRPPGPQPLDDAGQEAQLLGVKRDARRPRLLVAHDVDERSVAIEDRDAAGPSLHASHFVAGRWSFGWLTRRCQITAQKPSVCGVIRSGETVGMTTHASATCLVYPPSRPTIAEDLRADLARELERADEVHADVLLPVAAADAEDEDAVLLAQPRALEPLGEAGVPPLVVHPRGELGDVVGRRVGLEAADLAEVVDRVAGVPGRAPDAEDEEAPAASRTPARPSAKASIAAASSLRTRSMLSSRYFWVNVCMGMGFTFCGSWPRCARRRNRSGSAWDEDRARRGSRGRGAGSVART